MSNIANTIQYLKSKENRYITITVQETGKSIGKANIYLADLPNEDLEQYIKNNLGPITKPTLVWVEMRSKQGATSKKDHTCAIEISSPVYQSEMQPVAHVPTIAQALPFQYQQQVSREPYLGSPDAFGLGVVEVVKMQVNASRYEDKVLQLQKTERDLDLYKEKVNSIEEDYKKKINTIEDDFKRQIKSYDDELRVLKTNLSAAEKDKNLEILLAKLETKSFADSPAFASIMEKAPELISAFVAMKSGGAAPAIAGALGAPMTEGHRQLLEHIAESLDENQVNFLGSVCRYIDNEGFTTQLRSLIQQYAHA